jgi:hypothetical protein
MRRVPVAQGTPGAGAYVVPAIPTPGPAGGLTPAELASVYGYSTSATGQKVGIVDAYNDPNIAADLASFDSHYGLSSCTESNGCLTVVSQTGSTTALPANDTTGWSTEETLDVETVRAVCPNCRIYLVEANSASWSDLGAAENEAIRLKAQDISNSYGGPDSAGLPVSEYNHPGIVITASTGDDGWYGWDFVNQTGGAAVGAPNFPSTSPFVVAVGGTTLDLNQSGGRGSETVWNNNGPKDEYGLALGASLGATGGGCSNVFTAQPWQSHAYISTTCVTRRLPADISAVGDPLTGFDIYDTYNYSGSAPTGWQTVGGTSLSSPLIAAMWALAGGAGGVEYPSLSLYGKGSTLYDVTAGGSGFCGGETAGQCNPYTLGFPGTDCDYTSASSPAYGVDQCDARPGYDGPSGVGTPIGLSAFRPKSPTARISGPTSVAVDKSTSYSGGYSTDPFPGGTIVTYTWTWGDGSSPSSGKSVSHTWKAKGTYTVTLSATDNYNRTGRAQLRVTVG